MVYMSTNNQLNLLKQVVTNYTWWSTNMGVFTYYNTVNKRIH